MRFVDIAQYGGPEVLRIAEAPQPQPGPGEVLIRVRAAGINRADLLQREGNYPPPPGASPILGLEISGEVVELGAGVTEWKPGDMVCALLAGGGYAEYCAVPAGQCLPIPAGVMEEEAAALPEAVFTVWANLFDPLQLYPGESLLVHGGTSGIGSMAIQMAKAFGARVITTAGSEEKCSFCLMLGSEKALDYRKEDWLQAARSWTGERGVDVILDMVGGDYFPKHLELLARRGRLVHLAYSRGREVTADLATIMQKRLVVTGSTLRSRPVTEKTALRDALLTRVWPQIASGKIRPIVDKIFPVEEVAEAHRHMASSRHIGKILLRMG